MKKDIFISHASGNSDIAYKLVDFLESNSIECFVAPRDVDPGKPYASNLMHAIEECDITILIASSEMNESVHVLNEVDVVVAKKKIMIPLFIEEFEMSDDYRYYLGRTHRIIAYPDRVETYFSKILDTILQNLPEKAYALSKKKQASSVNESREISVASNTTTVFEYIPERGIMINPEDQQRNVSFRTDTFINLFTSFYDKIAEISDISTANEMFFESGYISGKNFAQRLNSRWDFAQKNPSSYKEQLEKWCEFDSNVGWGKFDISIDINEAEGTINGTLKINESFIVNKKSKKHICEFIKGYCNGVIETLLDVDILIECVDCPLKNHFKTVCEFKFSSID